jgi:O-antigen ligase
MIPAAALFAMRAPFMTVLTLYILAVPFDAISDILPSGTATRAIGTLLAILGFIVIFRREGNARIPFGALGWLGLVALMAASLFWALDETAALHEVASIVSNVVLMVIIATVPFRASEIRGMMIATAASGALAGLVAIGLAMHGMDFTGGRFFLGNGRSVADPNGFAASLLLPIAAAAGLLFRGGNRTWQVLLLLGTMAFTLAGVFLAASRGAFVALVVMGIVAVLSWGKHRLAALAALAVSIATVLLTPNRISQRLFAQGAQTSGAGRLDIWRVGLAVFKEHPLWGSGFANFPAAYDRAFFKAYEPQYEGWHRGSHSLLVSTATELGVLGLIVLTIAIVFQYRSILPKTRVGFAWLRITALSAFTGLLVAALFVDVLTKKYAWLNITECLVVARVLWPERTSSDAPD